MTPVRIAHFEPWPGKRLGGRGFRIASFLVVLADEAGNRAMPLWLSAPDGHGMFKGRPDFPHPEPAEEITARLLEAAGVSVTGVDIEELDAAATAAPQTARDARPAPARITFTATDEAVPGQVTARIGYALALALATASDAPIRVADELMDRFGVPAEADLVAQFTRDVPVPKRHRRFPHLFRAHPQARLAPR